MIDIAANLDRVRARIQNACSRCDRNPDQIRIIAITKTHPPSLAQQIVKVGIRDLGENRVQELLAKIPDVTGGARWHMVGHLQSNKVRKIVGLVDCIQSVDSFDVASEIERVAVSRNLNVKVLVQVNTSAEQSKFGCKPEEAADLVQRMSVLSHLRILGLMTLGKLVADPQAARPGFALLRELGRSIAANKIPGVSMDVLSMGMSGDFEVAIEEGATWVRIGTALFGSR